jgi:hypothetical protein
MRAITLAEANQIIEGNFRLAKKRDAARCECARRRRPDEGTIHFEGLRKGLARKGLGRKGLGRKGLDKGVG